MDSKQLQKQQEIQILQHQEESIHESVNRTEAPVLIQTEPVHTERILTEEERLQNLELQNEAQQLGIVRARIAAPGEAVQQVAPAHKSFKERMEERKKARKARRAGCAVPSAASYDMMEQLKEYEKEHRASSDSQEELIQSSDLHDPRVVRRMVQGYQKDKEGNPATPQDEQKMLQDQKFIEDYCSKDLKRRRPYLERFVSQMFNARLEQRMFEEDYICKHLKEVQQLADTSLLMDTMMKDPINQPFFQNMAPEQKDMLKKAFEMFQAFHMVYLQFTLAHDIDINQIKYNEASDVAESASVVLTQAKQILAEKQAEYLDVKDKVYRLYVTDYAKRARVQGEALNRVKRDDRVNIAPSEENCPYLVRSVVLMKQGEGAHEENVALVQTMMQIYHLQQEEEELNREIEKRNMERAERKRERAARNFMERVANKNKETDSNNEDEENEKNEEKVIIKPDNVLYEKTRAIAAPVVEKVLGCDVDALAALDDEALMLHVKELNDLCLDNMFVTDVMKLRHPYDEWDRYSGPMTLYDDLVGQRELEYSYKASMLRGLAERARVFSIRGMNPGQYNNDEIFAPVEMAKYGKNQDKELEGNQDKELEGNQDKELKEKLDKELKEKLDKELKEKLDKELDRKLNAAKRLMDAARKKYDEVRKPGSEENRRWVQELIQKGAHLAVLYPGTLRPVEQELYSGQSDEVRCVMARVQDAKYYSLSYTEEEMAQMHKKPTIGEPIFRSFSSFVCMEAAQKMLTPDSFRQMVMDLGAGASMQEVKDEETGKMKKVPVLMRKGVTKEAELQAAIEKNKRGLATMKRILEAQMDMMSRKYGTCMEHADMRLYQEHYREITQDVKYGQVLINMIEQFPDLYQLQDPKERLTYERLRYYMGQTYQYTMGLPAILNSGKRANANTLIAMVQSLGLAKDDVSQARKYLLEHDPFFAHDQADWSQKVSVPGETEGVA